MTVARADLERTLATLRAEVRDPRAGLYGPGSVTWEISRELFVFVGGGRAALLQLAHPYVAHAVAQHSRVGRDVLGRFRRTFDNVFAMVFGDLEHALGSARRVHALHGRISGAIHPAAGRYPAGHRYEANDEQALLWVHATLIDTAVQVFERVVRPLSPADHARHYAETRRFALLFGIDERTMPPDWDAFRRYFERTAAGLTVTPPARELAGFLLQPPALRPASLARWYRAITAGLLPEPLRAPFGLSFGARERAVFAASWPALWAMRRALPPHVRQQPAYRDALRRLAGKCGRDPVGTWVERVLLEGPLGG
jgi:uncharacterized protein (DUF2236 family)